MVWSSRFVFLPLLMPLDAYLPLNKFLCGGVHHSSAGGGEDGEESSSEKTKWEPKSDDGAAGDGI